MSSRGTDHGRLDGLWSAAKVNLEAVVGASRALAILRLGVEGWNAWRTERLDVEPDLSEADLVEAHLAGANLRAVNLQRANLHEANLSPANLSRANLSETDLTGTDLTAADIHGAALHGANLSRAHLTGANLSGANLSGANLTGAELRVAHLSGANLRTADLRMAYLYGSVLRGADLRQACLRRAQLIGVDFRSARFSGVLLSETTFGNSDLTGVSGLSECDHEGPSIVDHRTIARSEELPLSFLRGVGLPDWLIETYRGYLGSPIQFYSCFISYSHDDKPFAQRLHDQLQGQGIRCWLDQKQLRAGDDLYAEVDRGIRLWDKVLLCCSEASLSSGWVEREIDTAVEKEQRLRKERGKTVLALIPLNLDGHLFEWEGAHGAILRKRLALDFTGWETDNATFEAQFEKIVQALRADERAREEPPVSRL